MVCVVKSKNHLCSREIDQVVVDHLVVFNNEYTVRKPTGNSVASLNGPFLVESANADAAENGECLLGALDEIVDAADGYNRKKHIAKSRNVVNKEAWERMKCT